jgi:hypothetical protein
MDGTRENHLKQSKPGSEGQKSHVLPHIWIIDPKQIKQYYWTWVTHSHWSTHMGGIGKGKET